MQPTTPVPTPPAPANFDESRVVPYTLPDLLLLEDGQRVTSATAWRRRRRELLKHFETQVYGRSPPPPRDVRETTFVVTTESAPALDGQAVRKEVTVYPLGRHGGQRLELLLCLPPQAPRPVPAFVCLNFRGNHTIHADPGITISTNWERFRERFDAAKDGPLEAARGSRAHRFPLDAILGRGYAFATCFYGDLEPDFPNGWEYGVRGARIERFPHAPDSWGAIGAWAWGLSRILDYLAQDPAIDSTRVAVMGHSRLGKTALWAAAQDERFALAISNDSGCGGAALSRRNFGETVALINAGFPHWFCDNFKRYNDNAAALPVDQHALLALLAPRPVYVASAAEDLWADPRGEFLSALHADPVYRLLGLLGLGVTDMPGIHQPVGQRIGYHVRAGKHDVTRYDWDRYLDFADRHLVSPPSTSRPAVDPSNGRR